MVGGTSQTLACYGSLSDVDALELGPQSNRLLSDPKSAPWSLKSKPPFTQVLVREVSSAMATRILRMFPLWSEARLCGWPKHGPSAAHCAKHLESRFARSKN